MTFGEVIFAVTEAFGWVIIAAAVIALFFVLWRYAQIARDVLREGGWPALWQHIRVHVLTRKPRRRQ